MGKKKKRNSFGDALRDNQKRIMVVLPGSEEEIRLSDATDQTLEGFE